MIGSEGIYHTSFTWLAGSGASLGPVCVVNTRVYYPAVPFGKVETSSQYVSLRVRQRDRHTDKQTGSSVNQGWGPLCPCSGGSGDYMLWSARGPYWGTCRATVNPSFQIKVTSTVKLQNPSPFRFRSRFHVPLVFDVHKTSFRTALSVCTIYNNTFSPCFHLTCDVSTMFSWTTVSVAQSTSIQGRASSVCQSTTQNVFIGRLNVWKWAGEG